MGGETRGEGKTLAVVPARAGTGSGDVGEVTDGAAVPDADEAVDGPTVPLPGEVPGSPAVGHLRFEMGPWLVVVDRGDERVRVYDGGRA